jgi:hypothetical protein
MSLDPGYANAYTKPATGVKRIREVDLGTMATQDSSSVAITGGTATGVTTSGAVQEITEAGAISLDSGHVKITGPASSTYAVTLAAPSRGGQLLVLEMVSTTSTNAVTLALTNVIGGSAGSSASFNAAAETLVLVSQSTKWVVLKEQGVTLS